MEEVSRLLLLSLFIIGTLGVCPHKRTDLVNWSSERTWNVAGADVTIPAGTFVLMDVSPPKLSSIIIKGDLVFNNTDLSLNVDWIRVDAGGKFLMGSTESGCAITSRIVVTFFGDRDTDSPMGRDPYDDVPLGAKGLAVLTDATIQVVGSVTGLTWTRISQTAVAGTDTIILGESVTWKAGDSIVIAGTDYHETVTSMTRITNYTAGITWLQGRGTPWQDEVRTIVSVSNGGRTIKLNTPLNYTHWGQDYEKAEVGLLNRRITFQGDDSSISSFFGGHIMVRKVQLGVFVGVEVFRMGQRGVLGRYPIHFHMTKDTWDMGYLIKDCAFRENHQRCITIHYTCGLTMDGNVAFNNTGHCYFLEDGSERGNTFNRNLGIKTRPVGDNDPLQILPTDDQPAMFWITNPNNTFTNNAAVGGRFGYWFSMPARPTGPSGLDFPATDAWVRPRNTPLAKFDSNIAHSCARNGIHIDDMVVQDTLITELAGFSPRLGPFTGTSNSGVGPTEALFTNIIVYKNRLYGVWARGGQMVWDNVVSLDNMRGFNTPPSPSVLQNSLIVGETDNIGFPLKAEMNRSRPDPYSNSAVIKGWETYDNGGMQYAQGVTFVNISTNSLRKAGALSQLECGPFLLQTRDAVRNLTFINSNRVWITPCSGADISDSWAIFDQDGSVTGKPQWIVSNSSTPSLLIDDTCTAHPEWNAYECPSWGGRYVQIFVSIANAPNLTEPQYNGTFTKVDNNLVKATWVECGTDGTRYLKSRGRFPSSGTTFQVMANLKPRSSYMVRFLPGLPTPPVLTVRMASALPNDWVYIVIPYPATHLPLTIALNRGPNMTPVSSLADLVSKYFYYYDNSRELLYLRLDAVADSISTLRNFSNVNGDDGWSVTINAACSSGNGLGCQAPTKMTIPPKVPTTPDDMFVAKLEACQSATNKFTETGNGYAFVRINRLNRTLHYSLVHDQMYNGITEIAIKQGGIGKIGTTIVTTPYLDNPVHYYIKSFSRLQWESLLKGQWYISVKTSSSDEAIRGQIGCSGTCGLPPPVSIADPCSTDAYGTDSYPIYTDFLSTAKYTTYAYTPNDQKPIFNTTQNLKDSNALCGNNSMMLNISRSGNSIIGLRDTAIDVAKWKYLQFYAKLQDGESVSFNVFVHNGVTNIANMAISSQYIDNFALSDQWTRVRIPLADLNFVGNQTVNYVGFTRSDWNKPYPIAIYVDEVRFISDVKTPMGTGMTASEVYQSTDICYPTTNPTVKTQNSNSANPSQSGSTPTPSTTEIDVQEASGVALKSMIALIVLVSLVL